MYTIFLDYLGGTYISQEEGTTVLKALERWSEQTSEDNLKVWELSREELLSLVEADAIVAVEGLANVWCTSASTAKGSMLVHLVLTNTNAFRKASPAR